MDIEYYKDRCFRILKETYPILDGYKYNGHNKPTIIISFLHSSNRPAVTSLSAYTWYLFDRDYFVVNI